MACPLSFEGLPAFVPAHSLAGMLVWWNASAGEAITESIIAEANAAPTAFFALLNRACFISMFATSTYTFRPLGRFGFGKKEA